MPSKPTSPKTRISPKSKRRPSTKTTTSLVDLRNITSSSKSAVEAAAIFHEHINGRDRFELRYKKRVVPMVVRKINLRRRTMYMFQVAYTIDENTGFVGMRIFVGGSMAYFKREFPPEQPNEMYVANIHALPAERWTGSDMIELALGIGRALGVKRASLYDMTTRTCSTNIQPSEKKKRPSKERDDSPLVHQTAASAASADPPTYDLSMIMLLSRSITFYGRFGFRPTADQPNDFSYLPTGRPTADLCDALKVLSRVRVSSFVHYLRAMLRRLTSGIRDYRLVLDYLPYGVRAIIAMSANDLTTAIPERVTIMKRLLAAFEPRSKDGPLLALFEEETLPCDVKADFMDLLNLSYFTLRHGLKANTKPTKGKDVEWPAWTYLSRVMQIRVLYMETVVQPDPTMQRQTSFCI